jgi:hypothetical protein
MTQWSIEQLRAEAALARSLAERDEMLIQAIRQIAQLTAGNSQPQDPDERPDKEP